MCCSVSSSSHSLFLNVTGLGSVRMVLCTNWPVYVTTLSRLGLMLAVAIVLVSFMTHASEQLAIRWFLKGLEDGDTTRSKSVC